MLQLYLLSPILTCDGQSHYIEVAQGGIFTIDCEYLDHSKCIIKSLKKIGGFSHLHFVPIFSANATIYMKKETKKKIAPENIK